MTKAMGITKRGNGLKGNTPRPAIVNNSKIEKLKNSDDEKCKHDKWIFNCYDGCYKEEKRK